MSQVQPIFTLLRWSPRLSPWRLSFQCQRFPSSQIGAGSKVVNRMYHKEREEVSAESVEELGSVPEKKFTASELSQENKTSSSSRNKTNGRKGFMLNSVISGPHSVMSAASTQTAQELTPEGASLESDTKDLVKDHSLNNTQVNAREDTETYLPEAAEGHSEQMPNVNSTDQKQHTKQKLGENSSAPKSTFTFSEAMSDLKKSVNEESETMDETSTVQDLSHDVETIIETATKVKDIFQKLDQRSLQMHFRQVTLKVVELYKGGSKDEKKEICRLLEESNFSSIALTRSFNNNFKSDLLLVFSACAVLPPLYKIQAVTIETVAQQIKGNRSFSQLIQVATTTNVLLSQPGQTLAAPLTQILKSVKEQIKERWIEIKTPNQLANVLNLFQNTNHDLQLKLLSKVIEHAENMKPKDFVTSLRFMAHNKIRDNKVLQLSSYYLCSKGVKGLSLQDVVDTLYCCSSLYHNDVKLLAILCEDLLQKLTENHKNIPPFFVESICSSLGVLRYLDTALVNQILEYVDRNQTVFSEKQLVSVFYSMAMLGYMPQSREMSVAAISDRMTKLRKTKPVLWLRYVWCLSVSGHVQSLHISSVLEDAFVSIVKDSKANWTMLCKLDSYAQHVLPDYTGHRLDHSMIPQQTQAKVSEDSRNLIEILKKMAGNFYRENVQFSEGITIDAELCLGKDGKIQPLSFLRRHHNNKSISNGVALQFLSFKDCTQGKIQPSGQSLLTKQLLEHCGYHVIQITYKDWGMQNSVMNKVDFIQDQFFKVAEQMS